MQSNKNQILPGNCTKGKEKRYLLAKLYKTILLSEDFLQQIKIIVKRFNHFSGRLSMIVQVNVL